MSPGSVNARNAKLRLGTKDGILEKTPKLRCAMK